MNIWLAGAAKGIGNYFILTSGLQSQSEKDRVGRLQF